MLTLSATVLDPASHGGSKIVDRVGLAERFGADAEESLIGCGLVEVIDDQTVVVKDVATFDYVEQLAAIGLPVDAIVAAVEVMSELQVRGVGVLVDLYRKEVWSRSSTPACLRRNGARSPRSRVGCVSSRSGLGGQTLRQATDIVIGQVAVEQATGSWTPEVNCAWARLRSRRKIGTTKPSSSCRKSRESSRSAPKSSRGQSSRIVISRGPSARSTIATT